MKAWTRKRRNVALPLLFTALYLTGGRTASRPGLEETGAVEGFVEDPQGRPVVAVTVSAEPERPFVGVLPTTQTDSQGHFLLEGLQPGKYGISVSKESENYPRTSDYFYGPDHPGVEVSIQANQVAVAGPVRLGPKGARLRGKVLDNENGARILNAIVIFYRTDSVEEYTENALPSDFNVLVPTDKAFRMKVRAPDYKTWYYVRQNTEEQPSVVHLAPDETLRVIVRLQRLTGKLGDR
jgi:Carboxypeptidase regulatory-like domain